MAFIIIIALFYFFVAQFMIASVLWGDENWWILGMINAAALCGLLLLYGVIYLLRTKKTDDTTTIIMKTPAPVPTQHTNNKQQPVKHIQPDVITKKKSFSSVMYEFLQHYLFVVSLFVLVLASIEKVAFGFSPLPLFVFVAVCLVIGIIISGALFTRKVYRGKKLFLPKDIVFLVSLSIGLYVYKITDGVLTSSQWFWTIASATVFFVVTVLITRAIKGLSIWKLRITRIYMLITIGMGIAAFSQLYFTVSSNQMITSGEQWEQFIGEVWNAGVHTVSNNLTQDWQVFIPTSRSVSTSGTHGMLIESIRPSMIPASGTVVFVSGSILSGDMLTGMMTGVMLSGDTVAANTGEEMKTGPVTYDELLPHLLKKYAIALSYQKTIRFNNIAQSNANYPYYKTAYDMRMIGKNINPTDKVGCDTYMVLIGLLEGWDIKATTDIKNAYRNYAQTNERTNNCEKNNFVQRENL